MAEELATPRVFISYSWTTDEHLEWVVKLAERLVGDGVDVILDQWDFKEGHDKYAFMERMVTDATVRKVLIICDKRYAENADHREGGVGTESQIILKDVYDKVEQEKFIPLIRERDDDGKEYVPIYLRNRKYIDFCGEDELEHSYEQLIRNIYGKPERVKPALGKPPAHLLTDSARVVDPAAKLARLRNAIERGRSHTDVMLQEYLDSFLGQMEQFRVKETPQKADFDEAVVQSITDFIPYRDSFIEMVILATGYMDSEDTRERLIAFMEGVAAYQERPDAVTPWMEMQTDNYYFIAQELFLYLIAASIRNKRLAAVATFIEHRYQVVKTLGGTDYVEFGAHAFNRHNRTLDDFRKQRLKLNTTSVFADLVRERATNGKVSFPDLVQADFLLFIRAYFPDAGGAWIWYPRLASFLGPDGHLELFAKATSVPGLGALKQLLRIDSLRQLESYLRKMLEDQKFVQTIQYDHWLRMRLKELLNLDALTRANS